MNKIKKLTELMTNINSSYIESIHDAKKYKHFDFLENLAKFNNSNSFEEARRKHIKNYDYDLEIEKRKQIESVYESEIILFREILEIYNEISFDEIFKLSTEQMKTDDDYLFFIKNGRILPKLSNQTTKKITQKANKDLTFFRFFNTEDQIFKLEINIKEFYFYLDSPNTCYFVTDEDDIIKVNGKQIEHYLYEFKDSINFNNYNKLTYTEETIIKKDKKINDHIGTV